MYHRIGRPAPQARIKGLCISPGLMRRQFAYLARAGYQVVPLDAVLGFVAGGPLPAPRPIAITFDDGYRSVYEHAFPALVERGFPATVFVVVDGIGATDWWEQATGDVAEPMLDRAQMREMAAHGIAFGSHTCSHAHLPALAPAQAQREIADSRTRLEEVLGEAVTLFAYPYGEYDPAVRDAVEASGYRGACSTCKGVNRPGEDPYLLRRVNVRRWTYLPILRRKLARAHRLAEGVR
jgi:peptidoglycan/xylan/chitin deacetylase (PgdA/CDA1 family)